MVIQQYLHNNTYSLFGCIEIGDLETIMNEPSHHYRRLKFKALVDSINQKIKCGSIVQRFFWTRGLTAIKGSHHHGLRVKVATSATAGDLIRTGISSTLLVQFIAEESQVIITSRSLLLCSW